MSKKLILFLGIGLSIFLVDLFLNPPNEDKTIYISNEEVIALINTWNLQVGREPNNDEIRSIIDSLIEEEILYREALRLGLDSEDRIIKRRLAQKISFLKQETLSTEPEIEKLEKFYEESKESYLIPQNFSFTHLYFAENKNIPEFQKRFFFMRSRLRKSKKKSKYHNLFKNNHGLFIYIYL